MINAFNLVYPAKLNTAVSYRSSSQGTLARSEERRLYSQTTSLGRTYLAWCNKTRCRVKFCGSINDRKKNFGVHKVKGVMKARRVQCL